MSERKRKNFTSQHKTKVALEAIRGIKTANEIGQEFGSTRLRSANGSESFSPRRPAFSRLSAARRPLIRQPTLSGFTQRSGD